MVLCGGACPERSRRDQKFLSEKKNPAQWKDFQGMGQSDSEFVLSKDGVRQLLDYLAQLDELAQQGREYPGGGTAAQGIEIVSDYPAGNFVRCDETGNRRHEFGGFC